MKSKLYAWGRTAALGLALILLAAGCSPSPPYKRVSLIPQVLETTTPTSAAEAPALRVAVAAILSPQSTSHGYAPLIAYLADRLGQPVEMVQRGTYAETNELLRTRQVDLAFVCTGAYIQGRRDFGMELLALPEVRGETAYHSYIIVPVGSPARRLEDLRGHVFAFTDPMSLSGYLIPLHLLKSSRESPDTFFSRTLFTYSHENSIRAVAEGWVDGAAVDSLVYDAMQAQGPLDGKGARLIWRSDPYGMPPVVVHPDLDAGTKELLRRLLLRMDRDPEGREVLDLMGVDRFVLADERLYDSARAVLDAVGGLE